MKRLAVLAGGVLALVGASILFEPRVAVGLGILALNLSVLVVIWRVLPRVWRGEMRYSDAYLKAVEGASPLGQRFSRHSDRAVPLAAIGLLIVNLCVVTGILLPEGVVDDFSRSPIFSAVVVGASAVGILLVLTTVCLNRPRFLIPPYLRESPAAFREWRLERTRKSAN